MSMHMESAWISTNGKKKSKPKFRSAEHARLARTQAAAWEKLLKKHDVKPTVKTKQISKPKVDWKEKMPANRCTDNIPSLDTGGNAVKKDIPVYTGDACIGIAILHKSCLQPVFNKQAAVDISKMRRD